MENKKDAKPQCDSELPIDDQENVERLYFVADAEHERRNDRGNARPGRTDYINGRLTAPEGNGHVRRLRSDSGPNCDIGDLAKPAILGRRGRNNGDQARNGGKIQVEGRSDAGGVVNAELRRSEQRDSQERGIQESDAGCSDGNLGDTIKPGLERHAGNERNGNEPGRIGADAIRPVATASGAGLVNGFWRDADWIYCRDEKYRAVEPGTFPLVTGAAARMGRLRGYGNAIVAPQAQAFIESYLDLG